MSANRKLENEAKVKGSVPASGSIQACRKLRYTKSFLELEPDRYLPPSTSSHAFRTKICRKLSVDRVSLGKIAIRMLSSAL